ncbi:MAG: pyrroline-5-carboxylate reductase [Nanoarchaeota archaeon]
MVSVGFVGAGRMATALMQAIKAKKAASSILASDRSEERRAYVQTLGFQVTADNRQVAKRCDVIVLAVKPQDIATVLDDLKGVVRIDQIVISIAAGVKLSFLQSKLKAKWVRVMPNAACLVGEMAAGYAYGQNITEKDKQVVQKIFSSAGLAFELRETDLDAVTALSGSGPAFFATIITAFADAAAKQGLDRGIAQQLALQTASGTIKLIKEGTSPEDLVKMVASPGGTTMAGLKVMEDKKLRQILADVIAAAADRSRELGR